MAVILLHKEELESGTIRPGDVVFCRSREVEYPLHVGVFAETSSREVAGPKPEILVRGLPNLRPVDGQADTELTLGSSLWSASAENWRADAVGAMKARAEARIREVLLVAEAHAELLTELDECHWVEPEKICVDSTRLVLDGVPLFLRGTCAQYVEYLYAAAGLMIVAPETRDPANPQRVYPATQLRAFWLGEYPLSQPWADELREYPKCYESVRERRATTR